MRQSRCAGCSTDKIGRVPLSVASSQTQKSSARRAESSQPGFDAPRALALWHLASLDAPTVAVIWTMAFAWAERVRLPAWTLPLVALVTWAAYVADRLLDAWRALREPALHRLRERHFFHWRHRFALAPMAVGAACIAAVMLAALVPFAARARDAVLAAAALAYFSGVHSKRGPSLSRLPRLGSFPGKEFLVGVLFTAGCALLVWNWANQVAAWDFWIPAAGFAALAWLNCMAIARWEAMEASRTTTTAGDDRTAGWISIPAPALAGIEIVLSVVAAAAAHPRSAALLLAAALSALLLTLLECLRMRMTPLTLRAAADLVLLTPAPLLIVAGLLR